MVHCTEDGRLEVQQFRYQTDSFMSAVSAEVQAFNTTMTLDNLYSWLRSNQLPENDCQIILGNQLPEVE